jgi:hypothetical protein
MELVEVTLTIQAAMSVILAVVPDASRLLVLCQLSTEKNSFTYRDLAITSI